MIHVLSCKILDRWRQKSMMSLARSGLGWYARSAIFSIFCAGAVIASPDTVAAAGLNGVRHSVAVAIEADSKPMPGVSLRGTLTANIRISAHSKTADFAGEVSAQFEDADLNQGTGFKEIWAQDSCHERRGLPRLWILHITGSVFENGKQIAVQSGPRQLGVTLPDDELKIIPQVQTSEFNDQSMRIEQARTLKSHLLIKVRLTSTNCAI